jgi:hypothetical protein
MLRGWRGYSSLRLISHPFPTTDYEKSFDMRDRAATPDQVKSIEAIRSRLAPLAVTFDAPPVHWIGGGDEGLDYCFECAEVEVANLKAKNPSKADGYSIDGGWDSKRESDGSAICYRCNRILGYSLTHHGFLSEVDHFVGSEIEVPLSPGSAYEIDAMLSAAEYDDHAESIADAIVVGLEAVASIETAERIEHLAICRWADDGGRI